MIELRGLPFTIIFKPELIMFTLTFRRRDLNNPAQCHRAEIFREGFNFQHLLPEKKSYHVDFSSKCKEIKFCSVFMNWSIR